MKDLQVGDLVKVKVTGQIGQVIAKVFFRYDMSYMIRTASFQQAIVGDIEIVPLANEEVNGIGPV